MNRLEPIVAIMTRRCQRTEASGRDAERALNLAHMEELMIGGGQRDRAQRHVEHFAVELDVGRFAQLRRGEVGEQPLRVLAHAGQGPAELRQR